jgi:large subunit ribosomal protein L18
MNHEKAIQQQRARRRFRVRKRVRGTAARPRLSVTRTQKHIYCQVIDDLSGKTLVAASTKDPAFSSKYGGNADAAKEVGRLLAQRAQQAGIQQVCLDRGSYKYHGRVAALASAVREAGIGF